MTFKTLKPFEIYLHAYSAKYVVARVFDVETKGAAVTCMAIFIHINFANIHICCTSTITKLYNFTCSDFYIHFCQNELQIFIQALPTHPW